MGIYRCNQCGFVSEDAISAVGAKVACAKCGNASTVYGTVFYVEKLVERYFAALRELATLKEAEGPTGADAAATPTVAAGLAPLAGDAFNTDALAPRHVFQGPGNAPQRGHHGLVLSAGRLAVAVALASGAVKGVQMGPAQVDDLDQREHRQHGNGADEKFGQWVLRFKGWQADRA